MRFKKYILTFLICLLTVACNTTNKESNEPVAAAEILYNTGMNQIQDKSYKSAVETFQKIESEYPYSKWATKGKIMSAYASYRAAEYDDAINFLESYIKLHPGSQDVAYAYYLKALSYYDRIVDVGRDQRTTELALNSLKEVTVRFPETEYARDAQLKLDLVNDHLAGKEMEVGRFYQKNGKCVGAVNRFKRVVDKYQTTSHTPEALHRMVECYMEMGIEEEAQKYASVLGYNFPTSKWYRYSYDMLSKDSASTMPIPSKPWYRKIL